MGLDLDARFSILFFGEILPGFEPAGVHGALQALLKCSPEITAQVFSGSRVRLRKGLPAAEVSRYRLHLEGIGLKVVVEAASRPAAGDPMQATLGIASAFPPLDAEDYPNPAPAPAPPLTPSPKPAPAAAAPASAQAARTKLSLVPLPGEEVVCQNCGEPQPPRLRCRVCTVYMVGLKG